MRQTPILVLSAKGTRLGRLPERWGRGRGGLDSKRRDSYSLRWRERERERENYCNKFTLVEG